LLVTPTIVEHGPERSVERAPERSVAPANSNLARLFVRSYDTITISQA